MRKEARESRRKIVNAWIRLLQHQPYEAIQIKAICQEAGVSRQTFYSHYENKDAVFTDLYLDMFREKCLDKIQDVDCFASPEFLSNMIDVYEQWSDMFIVLDHWDVSSHLTKDSQQVLVDRSVCSGPGRKKKKAARNGCSFCSISSSFFILL